jgi:small basic protein (TIGR04137 family)
VGNAKSDDAIRRSRAPFAGIEVVNSSLQEGFVLVSFPLVFYRKFNQRKFMSQHSSLRAVSKLGGKRNVLKRFERTEILKKRGQWKDGDRITGLRKTKPDV